MRKKVVIGILVIVTVLCIVFAACTDSAKYRGAENVTDYSQTDFSEWADGTLMVNGKVCTDCFVKIHPDGYAVIPILRITEELNGTIKWKNENIAEIECNDTEFILDTKKKVLIKNGMNYNIFDVLCGETAGIPYFAKEENDFIVADEWATPFISDINAFICVDSKQNIVYVDTKGNDST